MYVLLVKYINQRRRGDLQQSRSQPRTRHRPAIDSLCNEVCGVLLSLNRLLLLLLLLFFSMLKLLRLSLSLCLLLLLCVDVVTSGVGTTGSAGSADPHFLERGVKRGQGHRKYFRYLDRWILYSILQILHWKVIIFAWHCRNIRKIWEYKITKYSSHTN